MQKVAIFCILSLLLPIFLPANGKELTDSGKNAEIFISGRPDSFGISSPYGIPWWKFFLPFYSDCWISIGFECYYRSVILIINGTFYTFEEPVKIVMENFNGVGSPFAIWLTKSIILSFTIGFTGICIFYGKGDITIQPM